MLKVAMGIPYLVLNSTMCTYSGHCHRGPPSRNAGFWDFYSNCVASPIQLSSVNSKSAHCQLKPQTSRETIGQWPSIPPS